LILVLPPLSGTKVSLKSKRLDANRRKRLLEGCVTQEAKVIGMELHRRTILKGTG
jgi:hypothetical protein